MKTQFNVFLSAVMFLTRLPVGRWVHYNAEHLAQSSIYFPLVGALVGAIAVGALSLSLLLIPVLPAVLISMIATILATGALHEDGFADCADGFGGGFETERVLEIMKDSRLGTYGAIALWISLSLKAALLYEITSRDALLCAGALISGHTLGRFSSLVLIYRYPYVRKTASKSKSVMNGLSSPRLAIAMIYTLIITATSLLEQALLPLGFAALATGFAGRYFNRRIGGITGDTLGAASQFVELSVYLGILIQSNFLTTISLLWKSF
ncbi:cobalamin 5'-phosphate synthase [Chloroherpeton thalassium ATCC 35110]|uniref:Adenosylcobinamide-GDP ribazoletransferase n=1 Tax=Chloroherpeton thalassium (strain ATCC 35110 / GB-78) TaxID=517418 RepID=B3QST6_CHLT3|nr:adenosylcobinamide-GDP ribazoletransferase [Chloroherpeton thalassium]ACF12579.1 cobalamin 5'-phosphate synthase [Chloroherpeton thalassium ATCC 35110]